MRRLVPAVALLLTMGANGCHHPSGGQPLEESLTGLLFSQGASDLSAEEQASMADWLGLEASSDGTHLVDGTCGRPVRVEVRFWDLNADGDPEALVDYGNACTSGMAGTSVAIFVRDENRRLRPGLRVPGMIAEVRPVTTLGFSELLIGGPGFCFGLWRWTGEEYFHVRNEPQVPGGCDDLLPREEEL